LTLIFGRDHPAGKWSERHNIPAASITSEKGHLTELSNKETDKEAAKHTKEEVRVYQVNDEGQELEPGNLESMANYAVNEPLTMKTGVKIILSPVTWLPAMAYLTTFGLELAIDGAMANTLLSLFGKQKAGFNQDSAGYFTSIL